LLQLHHQAAVADLLQVVEVVVIKMEAELRREAQEAAVPEVVMTEVELMLCKIQEAEEEAEDKQLDQ
jgi:hypothetical protein